VEAPTSLLLGIFSDAEALGVRCAASRASSAADVSEATAGLVVDSESSLSSQLKSSSVEEGAVACVSFTRIYLTIK
jgi:hypothetical protein